MYGGGGISNNGVGTLILGNSTLSGNSAVWDGGGLYNNGGTATVYNSTFTGNSANGDGGGAIFNDLTLTLQNDTISGNSASSTDGSGLYNSTLNSVSVENTIIANSTGGSDCFSLFTGAAWTANVDNLIRTTDVNNPCPKANLTSDPKLSSLANNGGPTQTMALQSGSPAIDAGNDSVCADALTVNDKDQRGITRPQGPHCDIGAYEYGNIEVYIGGNLQESYKLGSSQSTSGTYANVNNGPVQIVSMNNTPIIASERVAYSNGSAWTSFAELMGLPQSQLTTTYVMPWYNNVDLNSQLRLGMWAVHPLPLRCMWQEWRKAATPWHLAKARGSATLA